MNKTSSPASSPLVEDPLRRKPARLAETGTFLDKILNSITDPIFVKDRQYRWVLLNDACCELKGCKREDLLGKSNYGFFPAEKAETFWAEDEAVFLSGKESCKEEKFTDDAGKSHTIVTKKALYTDENGEQFIVGIIRDITEQKRAEDASRESQALYHSLVEHMPASVFRKDFEGRYVFVNSRFCRLKGMAPQEILAKTPRELIVYETMQKAGSASGKQSTLGQGAEHHELIIRSGKPIELEETYVGPDGSIEYFQVVKSPVFGPDGTIIGSQGIQFDITERKRAEIKLNEANRRLVEVSRLAGMAEVAASVLHNVGNFLNSVNVSSTLITDLVKKSRAQALSRVAMLLREHANDLGAFLTSDPRGKEVPEYLGQFAEHLLSEQNAILQELQRLAENVEHIKDAVAMHQNYARISGVAESVNLADLVEEALRLNADPLQRQDVRVFRELEVVPPLNLEKHKILQILVNVVRNAHQACEESGRADKQMTIRVHGEEGRVKVTVADNGVGIAPENLARIFNHGFTTRKGGHGLCLHNGALAAREMGGSLTVQSGGPGCGAAFILELPCSTHKVPYE